MDVSSCDIFKVHLALPDVGLKLGKIVFPLGLRVLIIPDIEDTFPSLFDGGMHLFQVRGEGPILSDKMPGIETLLVPSLLTKLKSSRYA